MALWLSAFASVLNFIPNWAADALLTQFMPESGRNNPAPDNWWQIPCEYCAKPIDKPRKKQRFCSDVCQQADWRERHRKRQEADEAKEVRKAVLRWMENHPGEQPREGWPKS